jgi:hypothetical protein
MRAKKKAVCLVLALGAFFASPELQLGELLNTAAAVVGRPLTPVSYAGVARRTTRRAVAAQTPGVGVW